MNNIKKTVFKLNIEESITPPSYFAFPISSQAGSNSLIEACGYPDRLLTAYGELPAIFAGSTLYRDTALTDPFGEGSATRFHAITTGLGIKSIELDINGVILSIRNC